MSGAESEKRCSVRVRELVNTINVKNMHSHKSNL